MTRYREQLPQLGEKFDYAVDLESQYFSAQ